MTKTLDVFQKSFISSHTMEVGAISKVGYLLNIHLMDSSSSREEINVIIEI